MEVLQALYGEGLTEDYLMPTLELNRSLLKSMAQYERFAKQHKLNLNSLLVLLVLYYAKGACSSSWSARPCGFPSRPWLHPRGIEDEGLHAGGSLARGCPREDDLAHREGTRFCEQVFASSIGWSPRLCRHRRRGHQGRDPLG